MPFIILIPFVICVIALVRGTVQQAFLNVYLPVFMLCPIYFFWKIAALPPIDVSQAILVPLGLAMLLREMPRWRLSTMDLWMALFLFSTYYADADANLSTTSIFDLFNSCTLLLVPYMAGKLLIEQPGARIATVKRIVFLLLIASLIGAYEYRMGKNPYTLMWARFFPGEKFAWKTQIRWGWGRVSGPYGQSELAGIIFFSGLILSLYLSFSNLWEPKFASWGRRLPGSKGRITAAVLALTLLMTQARGPWLGCLLGLPIALIGRSKRTLRASLLVAGLGLVVAPVVYYGLKTYVDTGSTKSEEHQSAAYRSQLLDDYIPIAEQGGPFGWGQRFPQILGLDSIDNEYLLVALVQGWVGLCAFTLICLQTLYNFATAAIFSRNREDRLFGWSMLGIFAGFMLTIFTVFLGNQPLQLFFLIAGWSQVLRVRPVRKQPQFAFEHVYT